VIKQSRKTDNKKNNLFFLYAGTVFIIGSGFFFWGGGGVKQGLIRVGVVVVFWIFLVRF
jgi:hypothetical protein